LRLAIAVSGKFYVYLIYDIENNDLNTVSIMERIIEVNILPIDPCDITATNGTLLTSANITGGDTIRFSFEVYNLALSKARGGWYDAVYLSKFPIVRTTDIRLLTKAREKELNKNEFYKKTFELKIPLTIIPEIYYIVFVTDTSKAVIDSDRDNNQAAIMINICSRKSADIFLNNVTLSHAFGKLNFSWQLSADDELKAQKCDTFYLLTDKTFDFNDMELTLPNGFCQAFEIKQISSNTLTSIHFQKDIEIPFVPDGSYYGLVRTLTNVQESNLENNVGISTENLTIQVEELEMNKEKRINVKPNDKLLFKIRPDTSVNAYKIEFKTTSKTAYNDIFVNVNKIPTENSFLAKSRYSFSFSQFSIVRNVRPENYYIMVKSYLSMSNDDYEAIIVAKEVTDIDIDTIEPLKLSCLGKNTIKISGNFVPQKLE
ncbi:unnamed protein product, partial [Didymodactylos carnosus]